MWKPEDNLWKSDLFYHVSYWNCSNLPRHLGGLRLFCVVAVCFSITVVVKEK